MKKISWTLSLFLILQLISCGDTTPTDPVIKGDVNTDALAKSILNFGIDMMVDIDNGDDHVLISPLSIHNALALAANGAKEGTLNEILRAIRANDFNLEDLNASYSALYSTLEPSNDSTTLSINNAAFYDADRLEINDAFLENLKAYYDAEESNLDFDAQESVDVINSWASDKTNQRIPKVLDNIQSDELMFLINALYFISDWESGFDAGNTFDRTFTNSNQSQSSVPMMSSDYNRLSIISEGLEAVDLQCQGKAYSATFIKPKGRSVELLLKEMQGNSDTWFKENIDDQLVNQRIYTILPKFELKDKLSLKDNLKSLGMLLPFNGGDLSGFGSSTIGKLILTRVLHDAYVKVDEKGIEGAAVTTVGVGVTSAPPTIAFDSPFLFVLRHKETNTPIFIGKINKL